MTTCPTRHDDDQSLVEACLRGDQRAWALLIERYKRLIYSFPRRYGASEADAADVFQLVCAELFVSLHQLRNCQVLRAWIMTVASHQSYHWKRRHVQRVQREGCDLETARHAVSPAAGPAAQLERSARNRMIREAIAELPPRCQAMLQLLFYQDPPVSYAQVARELGLATGSIGLTRARCLKRLEAVLARVGIAPDTPIDVSLLRTRPAPPAKPPRTPSSDQDPSPPAAPRWRREPAERADPPSARS